MAGTNLDRILNIISQINMEASKTGTLLSELNRILTNIQGARVTGVGGDAKAFEQANKELWRYITTLERYYAMRGQPIPGPIAGTVVGGQLLPTTKAPTMAAQVAAQKAAQEATYLATRQQAFTETFGTNEAQLTRVTSALSKYGISLDQLSRVYIDPISKTRQFTFESANEAGVVSRATIAIDRFGNMVGDSGTRFRGFTDMLSRNIVKVLEWGVAVGLVYGSFRKLGEAMTMLKDFNEALANISIATGKTGNALNRFFEQAADAASATGTSLENVLNIYDDAIRATNNITNESQRYATANQLVVDALTFARLANLGQTEAMDDLIAATRQMNMGFDQSRSLLDVWVYASRRAKVDINDIADTFAITGAAAEEAGVDMYQLSAIATVMAVKTQKSATEIGNTIRRMIITMEDESGRKALEQYGVVLDDLDGKARDWGDIMGEIAKKVAAGAITAEGARKLAYAIGGGPRGAADVMTMLKSWDEVIARQEEFRKGAAGAAEAALATKTKTLTTALNQLSVSFGRLVQTLGTKGGLVDAAIWIAQSFSKIVDLLSDLTETLGPATTRMLAFAAAMALLQKYGPYLQAALIGARQTGIGAVPAVPLGQRLKAQAPQMGMVAAYAATQLLTEGTAEQKAIKVGTTIAGGIIGALTVGSPIIGAMIGDAAGSALVNAFEKARLAGKPISALSAEETAKEFERLQGVLETQVAPGGIFGKWFGDPKEIETRFKRLLDLAKEIGAGPAIKRATKEGWMVPEVAAIGVRPMEEELQRYIDLSEEASKKGLASPESTSAVKEQNDARLAKIAEYNAQVLSMTDEFIKMQQEKLKKMVTGDITRKEYKDFVAGIEDAYNRAGLLFDELKQIGTYSLGDVAKDFASFSEEVRDDLVNLVGKANQLEEALAKAQGDPQKVAAYTEQLKQVREEIAAVYTLAEKELTVTVEFKFLGFTDFSDYTAEEFNKILEMARQFQDQYIKELGIDPEQFKQALDDWVAYNDESFKKVGDVNQAFVNQAKSALDEYKKQLESFNLERLKEIGPEKFPELQARAKYWEKYLGKIPGYKGKQEAFNLVLGENNVFRSLITTQEALRFAIEDLTSVEKKQLEGMWNIPEGATVMVPLQSLYYAPKGGAGGGGFGEMPPAGLEAPAGKMDTAANKMLVAADMMVSGGQAAKEEATARMRYYGPTEAAGPTKYEQEAKKYRMSYYQEQQGYGGGPPTREKWDQASSVVINTTIMIDGEVIAKKTNRYQATTLNRTARSRGYGGGGAIT